MSATTKVLIGVTFVGAATACVCVTSSYPIAIWAVGFAAAYKIHQGKKPVECPLYQIAVAEEERKRVVDSHHRKLRENQSGRRSDAV